MKTCALILGLLLLGGCGTIENLHLGPSIYGGVRQDVEWMGGQCMAGLGFLDFPFSLVLDTVLLPVTVAFALTK